MITPIELGLSSDLDGQMQIAEEELCVGRSVQLRLKFRGRETAHTELGFAVIQRATLRLGRAGRVEEGPKLIGRIIRVTIVPFQ